MGDGQWAIAEEKTTDTLMRASCLYIPPITNRQYPISPLFFRQRSRVFYLDTARAMQGCGWT